MAGRSGGTPIRTRKVKPGYDQAFTLPKGTSAAPIKQVAVKKFPKPTKKPKISTAEKVAYGAAAGVGLESGADITGKIEKVIHKTKKIFKKPKSDLKSPGERKGYPHE
jgi:ribosomal protein L9